MNQMFKQCSDNFMFKYKQLLAFRIPFTVVIDLQETLILHRLLVNLLKNY